jgi:selenophosphate synthetase-related protein
MFVEAWVLGSRTVLYRYDVAAKDANCSFLVDVISTETRTIIVELYRCLYS